MSLLYSASYMKARWIFYLLVAYMFAALLWWLLLLLRVHEENFQEKIRLIQMEQRLVPRPDANHWQSLLEDLEKERRRKVAMVAGEGVVFSVFLLLLAVLMDRLLRREAQVLQQQKNFLLAITHELKSPIAAVGVALETLERHHDLGTDKKLRLVTLALTDLRRLGLLVDNLLIAARMEALAYQIQRQPLHLSHLLRHVLSGFQTKMEVPDRLQADIADEIWVLGDAQALTSMIANLVENAIKYGAGEAIWITLTSDSKQAILSVADGGKGIPDAEKKKIFQKFYRIGSEETRQSQGTGLGLFLVHRIATKHDGTIQVTDRQPKGSIFTVRLPLWIPRPHQLHGEDANTNSSRGG